MDIIDKVMHTYGMMVNLTPDEARCARERLTKFLADRTDGTRELTVEGIKFLRGERHTRTRRARSSV